MSQKRGRKRSRGAFDNLTKEQQTVKDLHKLSKPARKKRRTNRTLSRILQQTMGKATSAYMNEDYETAKSLAQEIVLKKTNYPDVFNFLGKVNEAQKDYSNALTAYQCYVSLRYPNKTIQSETSRTLFKENHNDNDSGDSDAEDSDFDDDSDKYPTAELIEKIANLALKSKNYSMALDMIEKIESHYRILLNKLKITDNQMPQIEIKRKEILNYLVNIHHKRANIYKILKQFDSEKKEYDSIYNYVHKNTHPFIASENKANKSNKLKMDLNHLELLHILNKICPKSYNLTSYRYLFNYFDIFMENNKFNVDNNKYIRWLIDEINNNITYTFNNQMRKTYKQLFYKLLSIFVSVGMEMCRFKAILKFLQFFSDKLSQTNTFPFTLNIKKGICLLWLNDIDSSIKYYNDLISVPQQTGYGSLYMLFLDGLIAKNKLKLAQDLMHKIEQIKHFDQPRIWLRFADCYTLQKKYNKAIHQYIKVINNIQNEDENEDEDEDKDVLLSARLKLLEIYFIINDEENAQKLLKIIQKYKEQLMIHNNNNTDIKQDADNDNDDGDGDTSDVAVADINCSSFKPQKKMRLNAQLTSYFEVGLFGSVIVPKELLQLELLNIELRAQYRECLHLFKTQQYSKYLIKCESKIIQLFAICHHAPNLINNVYCVTFEKQIALPLKAYNEQLQIGAVVTVNYHTENDETISKLSQIVSINGEKVKDYKFDEIKHILNLNEENKKNIEFIREQNIFPLLVQNRNIKHWRIYSINHLAQVLKDSHILELVVYLCKIWYECDANVKNIELILNLICEASSSLNPHKLEFNEFFMAELHLLMANIYFNDNNFESCYHSLVKVLELQPNSVNAMRYLYTIYRHSQHHPKIERTIKRQLEKKNDENINMVWHQLILGHTSFSKNSYDIAANTYANIIKNYRNSPFMHLMLGVTFLQHAMKRTTKGSKYFVIIQGIAFIKRYVKLSKNNTESLYNFARAFHLLGLYGSAQILYEKIINRIKYIQSCNDCKNSQSCFNPIRRYCAYNLSKIYLRSGQNDLAIQTLKQNIIV